MGAKRRVVYVNLGLEKMSKGRECIKSRKTLKFSQDGTLDALYVCMSSQWFVVKELMIQITVTTTSRGWTTCKRVREIS